jgi:predicted phosphodiesterase
MRFGVISDIHGNLQALHAVIAAGTRYGVDSWLCAGDLVGYGARPNECVDLIRDLDAVTVAGNHDLIAVGALRASGQSPLVTASHAWTSAALRADVRDYLAGLPRRVVEGEVVLVHGSLSDPEEYVRSVPQHREQVEQLGREGAAQRLLVLGHTHVGRLYRKGDHAFQPLRPSAPTVLAPGERYVLNPGSVGQQRDWAWPPTASAAVLDLEAQHVVPLRLAYDWRSSWRDLRQHGMPYRALHNPPPLRRLLRRWSKMSRTSQVHRRR